MRAENQTVAVAHAEQESPRESCGLLVVRKGREVYWPCKNLSAEGEQFILDPEDYAAADAAGEVIAVVHSHPLESALPSQLDMVACEASGAPWWIYSVRDRAWHYMEPSGYTAPLIGRQYAFGVLDCYTLIRDWYRVERGVLLPDFKRLREDSEDVTNIYLDNFSSAGFHEVTLEEVQAGDCFLMRLDQNTPHHGAVYIGDGWMLHHLHNRLSSRDQYTEFYQRHTTNILRYGNSPSSR